MQQLLTDGALGAVYDIYSQRLKRGQARPDVNAWWHLGRLNWCSTLDRILDLVVHYRCLCG